MFSKYIVLETRIQQLHDGLISLKGTRLARAGMLKMSRFYTLADILSKLFVKKRRKIEDLIYDHGMTN